MKPRGGGRFAGPSKRSRKPTMNDDENENYDLKEGRRGGLSTVGSPPLREKGLLMRSTQSKGVPPEPPNAMISDDALESLVPCSIEVEYQQDGAMGTLPTLIMRLDFFFLFDFYAVPFLELLWGWKSHFSQDSQELHF